MTYLDPEARRARDHERHAKWAADHPKKTRASVAKYRAAHPEKDREWRAKYRAAHPEKGHAADAKWRAANPEKAQEHRAKWYAEHPEKVREYGAKWRAANPEKVREQKARWRGAQLCGHPSCLALGPVALSWMTNPHVCWICGTPVWNGVNLHMDHVIPISKGGLHCATNLRPACAPCNVRKGATLIAQRATA